MMTGEDNSTQGVNYTGAIDTTTTQYDFAETAAKFIRS